MSNNNNKRKKSKNKYDSSADAKKKIILKKIKTYINAKKKNILIKEDEIQREFDMIKKIVNKTPEVRKEKVAALRNAIKNRKYIVKSKNVADKIIRESLFDLRKNKYC